MPASPEKNDTRLAHRNQAGARASVFVLVLLESDFEDGSGSH
jgi:hypothetical protein